MFASDEEALAAAEELYGQYLAAENQLGAGGWNDISLIKPYVRGAALADEIQTAQDLSAKGYHQVGDISYDTATLQQAEIAESGQVVLTVYLCLDVSGAGIVDATNQTIDVGERPGRLALEIEFDDVDGDLKVDRSEPWTGSDFC